SPPSPSSLGQHYHLHLPNSPNVSADAVRSDNLDLSSSSRPQYSLQPPPRIASLLSSFPIPNHANRTALSSQKRNDSQLCGIKSTKCDIAVNIGPVHGQEPANLIAFSPSLKQGIRKHHSQVLAPLSPPLPPLP